MQIDSDDWRFYQLHRKKLHNVIKFNKILSSLFPVQIVVPLYQNI